MQNGQKSAYHFNISLEMLVTCMGMHTAGSQGQASGIRMKDGTTRRQCFLSHRLGERFPHAPRLCTLRGEVRLANGVEDLLLVHDTQPGRRCR